jgi:simple sugar transport system permease protein
MNTVDFITSFLFSVIRVSTPLIYGALAAVVTRKAGLLNLAIESMMLASALTGVLVSGATQSLALGLLAGLAAAVAVSMVISYSSFVMKTDLYLTSIAMNTGLVGGTVFVMYLATGQKANTGQSIASLAVGTWDIPLIKDIPFLGDVLSGHNIFTYVGILMIVLVWFLLYKTKIGLRIRSVGENPHAAESVGISPRRIYFLSFGLSGVLSGLGGMFMSMGYLTWFARDMIAGRGFISMSAMNIANGEPVGSSLAALMFGTSDALSNYMQLGQFPSEIVSMFPYVSTIVLLIIITLIKMARFSKKTSKAAS